MQRCRDFSQTVESHNALTDPLVIYEFHPMQAPLKEGELTATPGPTRFSFQQLLPPSFLTRPGPEDDMSKTILRESRPYRRSRTSQYKMLNVSCCSQHVVGDVSSPRAMASVTWHSSTSNHSHAAVTKRHYFVDYWATNYFRIWTGEVTNCNVDEYIAYRLFRNVIFI